LLFLHAASSMAASFSCVRASTPQEKAICSDSRLSVLDERLAAAYGSVIKRLSSEGAARIQADQREWIKWLRVVCQDRKGGTPTVASCLQAEYAGRLKELQTGTQQLGGVIFFPRLKVLTLPDDGPPEAGSTDPGFGAGRFSWPEIDQPTPEQARWNAAMRAQTVRFSADELQSPAHDFVPEIVRSARIDITYTLDGANERLIAGALLQERYGYGAAHPNKFLVSFLWLPQKQRSLQAQDVFRPGSGWEELMVRSSYKKLKQSVPVEYFDADRESFNEGAAKVVRDVTTWRLDRDGLQINFPKYSIAAGAASILVATIPWTELKADLADGFDPATLPARRERN
jgi:uncharacterized protein